MINLFINLFNAATPERSAELMECLRINSNLFDRVYVINNTSEKVEGLINILSPTRPTFKDLFQYVNYHSASYDVNVIANSDISFTPDAIKAMQTIKSNQCFALSRYNNGSLFLRRDSQDAWIFRGWIKYVPDCEIHLGKPGSDNSICERLVRAGYTVSNPSFTIRINHNHTSNVRTYTAKDVTQTPYAYAAPTDLDGCRRFYATSINPYDRLKEQLTAIKTWNGGLAISFNTAKEIADLGQLDGVTFVEIPADGVHMGKYPKLSAILKWAKHLEFDHFVLINSDIAIADITAFNRALLSPNMVVGVRHDDGKSKFPHGYDVFALRPEHIKLIPETNFSLGLPWWDFFVPAVVITAGVTVDIIRDRPVFTHKWHETRYDYTKWLTMGEYFRGFSRLGGNYGTVPEMCTRIKSELDNKMIPIL